jgi:hypothetical protein
MQNLTLAGTVALHELLRADFKTGDLFWRKRDESIFYRAGIKVRSSRLKTWNTRYAGQKGFTCLDGHGYLMGRIFNKSYKAHRVLWALYYGEWPKDQIDHLNGVRNDNRIINLRSVSQSENNRNMKMRSDNKSGCVGVSFDSSRGKWMARINSTNIGRFDTVEDAAAARANHPEFVQFTQRHGA